jgi:hypothetical protein
VEAVVNESKRTSQVLKRFRELYPDGVAWKFNDRIAMSRPDACFLRGGDATFVEFKQDKNWPTEKQMLELKAVAKAGFRVFVVWFAPLKTFRTCRVFEDGFELPPRVVLGTLDSLCDFLS